MPYVRLADVELYYEIQGQGQPLLMIRGLGSNADHWYTQTPAFTPHYRVITFDNRGIGRSSNPGGAFGIKDMADDTLGLMDALGLERPHVFGLSMGGMIAQELAINHPERVRGLVLACTHPGGDHQVQHGQEVRELFTEMVYVASPEAKLKASPTLFDPANLAERPELAAEYAKVSLKHPAGAEILSKQWEAVLGHDTYERLGRIKAQTLVLTGDKDVLIPPGNSEILAERIPGAQLVVAPGGGHQILVERAEACNRVVLEFLSRVE